MIASIPKDKKAEYERAFRLFDQNGTNSITAKDIVKVMSTLGWAANLETIDYMVQEVDVDGRGEIGKDEWLLMLHGPSMATMNRDHRQPYPPPHP